MDEQSTSATVLVQRLDAAEIEKRIEDNEAERKALLILLRAAKAKGRSQRPKQQGATDAK